MEKLYFQAKMFRLFRVRVGTSAQAQKVQNSRLAAVNACDQSKVTGSCSDRPLWQAGLLQT